MASVDGREKSKKMGKEMGGGGGLTLCQETGK